MTAIPIDVRRNKGQNRKRVLMRGTLFAPDGAHVVWIRDVSRDGALISCDSALQPDVDILFRRGPIFAAGHIVWVRGRNAGLRFYRSIPEDKLFLASVPNPASDR